MEFMLLEMADEKRIEEYVKGDRYVWEIKKDGTRCCLSTEPEIVKAIGGKRGFCAFGRSGINMAPQFPELQEMAAELPQGCRIDGELYCHFYEKDKDKPTTSHRSSSNNGRFLSKLAPATFCCFDVIMWEGLSFAKKPLEERKQFLYERLAGRKNIEVIMPLEDPLAEWARIKRDGDEGLVAKLKGSPYVFERSPTWLKFKAWKEMDLPVVGFTSEKRAVSALILEGGYKVNFNLAYSLIEDFLVKSSRTGREIKALDGSVGAEIAPLWTATFRYLHKSPNGLRFPTLSALTCDETKV